jgi:hypothetical protein
MRGGDPRQVAPLRALHCTARDRGSLGGIARGARTGRRGGSTRRTGTRQASLGAQHLEAVPARELGHPLGCTKWWSYSRAGAARPLLRAVLGLAVDFRTWQTLVRREELDDRTAVALMVRLATGGRRRLAPLRRRRVRTSGLQGGRVGRSWGA